MLATMQTLEKGTKLLLHSCCAPCSSACLERLKDTFEITVLYYNPNIDEEAEYAKRKAEQIRFLKETGWANVLDCDHDAEAFKKYRKGWKTNPNVANAAIFAMRSAWKKRRKSPRQTGSLGSPRPLR